MILKKPYGLMIKHFRLIHLILSLLGIYILLSSRGILKFFQDYVTNDYRATILENMASQYINFFIYIAIIIVIGLCIALFVLLNYKKKPYRFYLYAIIYYIIYFITIFIAARLLNGLEIALWETSAARIYRDVSLILYLPQIFFIIVFFIRTIGLNVKQFDFKTDLADLELTDKDSEEVEINVGFETYKVKRTLRRLKRESGYYVQENKYIILSILVLLLIILIYLFIKNFEILNNTYKQGKTFIYDNFSINVEDSIISNLNYSGDVISKDNYYLVLKLNITNNSLDDKALNYNKFLIYNKNTYYEPDLDMGSNFIDYAEPYYGKKILSKENKTILLAYRIPKDSINANYDLKLFNGLSTKKKEWKSKSIIVDLSPLIIDEVDTIKSVNLNEQLKFNKTYLNDTTFIVKNYSITSKYEYNYESCFQEVCNTYTDFVVSNYKNSNKNILLVLDYDFKIDKTSTYSNVTTSANTFAEDFLKIRYKEDDKEKIVDLNNVTPNRLKDKLVLQANNNIQSATSIDLLVVIRNNQYVIKLK